MGEASDSEQQALADVQSLLRDVVAFLGPIEFGDTGVTAITSEVAGGFALVGLTADDAMDPLAWIAANIDLIASVCTAELIHLENAPVVPVVAVPARFRQGQGGAVSRPKLTSRPAQTPSGPPTREL